MHLAGVLIYARPASVDFVCQQISALPGVELHLVHVDGKLVVTVENEDERTVFDIANQFFSINGVISASITYHHSQYEKGVSEYES